MMAELEAYLIELETGMGDKYIEIKVGLRSALFLPPLSLQDQLPLSAVLQANHLGQAVIKYFLEDGTSWATAPPVKVCCSHGCPPAELPG